MAMGKDTKVSVPDEKDLIEADWCLRVSRSSRAEKGHISALGRAFSRVRRTFAAMFSLYPVGSVSTIGFS